MPNKFTEYMLKNGMRVIVAPKKGTQAMTALVFVTVGSRYEPERTAGISHFLEHMCFKGTKKRPTAKIIARTLDGIGADYNAYTNKEYTGYYIKADARHTDIALDMLSDVYYNSVFDAKEIEREKGPVCQEIKMYEDNPLRSIYDWFEHSLFGGHTLGRDVAGSIKTVRALTRDDVVAWHNQYYHAVNTTIVLAGCVVPGALQMIKRYFKKERSGAHKELVPFTVDAQPSTLVSLKQKKMDQVQVMLGFPGYQHDHKDNAPLIVLQTILGAGMSSRLFTEVRERRGLAYLVRSGFDQYIETGSLYVHAGVDKEKVSELLRVVMNELHKLKTKSVSAQELQEAKEQWRGKMVLASEDSSWQAQWYAEQVFLEHFHTPDHFLRLIQNVTAVDIKRVARDIIHWDRLRIAIIGPTMNIKILEKQARAYLKHLH